MKLSSFDKSLQQALKREELLGQLFSCKFENNVQECKDCPDFKECKLIKAYKKNEEALP